MRASRAHRAAISAALSLTLLLGVLPVAAAGPTLPLPDSIAAVGDSITQAASSAGSLGTDAPQNSWATGTSTSVNSHASRLVAAGATTLTRHNLSVSGAKMVDLPGQILNAAAVQPDYLTVLIGGNDVCTSSESSMTDPAVFEADFSRALTNLRAGSPDTRIYVVSIPRVMGLWELFRNNFWARFIWSVGNVCQSLLANPTSTNQADVDRRARVDARNRAFNEILARVCAATTNCHHDGGAAFATSFATSDVSGDYFHPSVAGQAKLASVSWSAGYAWTATPQPNVAPAASFTHTCTHLACTFDDTSTDADGTIVSRAWSFGGSGDPQPHTFATAGTHAVTLTVTDDDGASSTATSSVTVTAAPTPTPMWVSGLTSTAVGGRNSWTATVTITVSDASGTVAGAAVSGSWTAGSGTSSCTTSQAGTCQVTVTVNKKTSSTRYSVSTVAKAGSTYQPASNTITSITITKP